ncbi:MAG: hypothetical protein Q7R78_02340 [bacterium]|nr:hypothetical protein [bacterium]
MNKNNIIILVVVIALVGGGIWYYKSKGTGTEDGLSVSVANTPKVGQKTLSLLRQVSELTLDTKIFDDPAFTSLVDSSIVIPPQPVGRINPFSPTRARVVVPSTTRR